MLGRATGLKRTGVSLARVPPGKESFVYHAHQVEEEWVYILSGEATVEIDGTENVLRAGDFAGFPPSTAHHLRNTGSVDVVYLMGGDDREVEIVDFPRLGRRMIRRGATVEIVDLSDLRPFVPSSSRKTD